LKKRNETVVAKGKGEMQMMSGGDQEDGNGVAPLPLVNAMQSRLGRAALDNLDPESSLPPKIKRLIDWNVDVIMKSRRSFDYLDTPMARCKRTLPKSSFPRKLKINFDSM
jgi:hypothetical protein